jgi:hypothetical protein
VLAGERFDGLVQLVRLTGQLGLGPFLLEELLLEPFQLLAGAFVLVLDLLYLPLRLGDPELVGLDVLVEVQKVGGQTLLPAF